MEKIKANILRLIRVKKNASKPLFDLSMEAKCNIIGNSLGLILQANEPNNKPWDFANNKLQIKLLLAWFCKDSVTFKNIANDLGNSTLDFGKNLYICGEKGSGKSSTVFALNEMITTIEKSKAACKTRHFKYIEQNKIINTFEVESNINKYTYNETSGKFEGDPFNLIVDDLKFAGLTKSFGTNFHDVLIRFLYDRYSLWLFSGVNTIITSLLTPLELKEYLPDDLYNRFQQQYNIIHFQNTKRMA